MFHSHLWWAFVSAFCFWRYLVNCLWANIIPYTCYTTLILPSIITFFLREVFMWWSSSFNYLHPAVSTSLLCLIIPCPQYSVLKSPTAIFNTRSASFSTKNLFAGIHNLKTISVNSTLAELGMDSITVVEIKETLEREFEVFLTPQEIRKLTFASLDVLSAANPCTEVDKRQLKGTHTILFWVGELVILENKGVGFALLSWSHHKDIRDWRYSSMHF